MTTHNNYAESENTYNILDTICPYSSKKKKKKWKSTCGYNQLSSLYTFVCLIHDFKIDWHFHFLYNPQWLQKSMSEILNLLSSLDMVFTLFMFINSGLNWVLALDDLCRGLLLLCTKCVRWLLCISIAASRHENFWEANLVNAKPFGKTRQLIRTCKGWKAISAPWDKWLSHSTGDRK